MLAAETGPETMPAPHLLNIVLAVLASRDGQQAASDGKKDLSLSPSSLGPPGGGEGGHGYADDEQEKYLRDLEADTEAHVRKAQQRIRELDRLRVETAAEFARNKHKIKTVMRDFDRMAQAQGYAGAFDDGSRGPPTRTLRRRAATSTGRRDCRTGTTRRQVGRTGTKR